MINTTSRGSRTLGRDAIKDVEVGLLELLAVPRLKSRGRRQLWGLQTPQGGKKVLAKKKKVYPRPSTAHWEPSS